MPISVVDDVRHDFSEEGQLLIRVRLRCGHEVVLVALDQCPDPARDDVRAGMSIVSVPGRDEPWHFCNQCPEPDESSRVDWSICPSCHTPHDARQVAPNGRCYACWMGSQRRMLP